MSAVQRISDQRLDHILNNRVLVPVTCIIKFYSNNCHLCHALQGYYVDVAKEYEMDPNIVFYAYNIDDDPSIEKKLHFKGVPTIAAITPNPDLPPRKSPKIKICPEPSKPHKATWYRTKDIKKFVEEEKIK